MTSLVKRACAFSFLSLLTIGMALGVAAPASAHNYLVSSTPADGEVLTVLPDEFVITTNDELLKLGADAGGFALQVQDADGLYYGDGCVAVDGPSMTAPAALGEPGDYLLTWQVVSIDGHTVSGEIPFSWTPDDISESSEGSTTPPVCGEAAEGSEPDPTPAATDEGATPPAAAGEDSGIPSELLWIAGALVVMAAAAGTTMLVLSRKNG